MQYKSLAKRNIKIKYLQMTNIDVHNFLQGFQGTHVAKITRTHQRSFIKDCSKLKHFIYSVPWARTPPPNTATAVFRFIRLHQHLQHSAITPYRKIGHFPSRHLLQILVCVSIYGLTSGVYYLSQATHCS